MKLKDIRDDYEELTGKVSELNRKCIYAGIAVVWIFRTTEASTIIPEGLQKALLFFIMGLGLDIFQYILLGAFWYIYYQYKKKKLAHNGDIEEIVVNEPEIINNLSMLFWFGKVVCTILGFYYIATFLKIVFL